MIPKEARVLNEEVFSQSGGCTTYKCYLEGEWPRASAVVKGWSGTESIVYDVRISPVAVVNVSKEDKDIIKIEPIVEEDLALAGD